MCCVGFLSVSSRVYAYTAEDGFYPVNVPSYIRIVDSSGVILFEQTYVYPSNNNVYSIDNGQLDNISGISIGIHNDFVFPYSPDLYDYYVLGSFYSGLDPTLVDSSFFPSDFCILGYDYNTGEFFNYDTSDLSIYSLDGGFSVGFGVSCKIRFDEANNIGIHSFHFEKDIQGSGSKPPSQKFEFGIMAILKGTSESEINLRILNKLSEMQESITDSIGSAADQVMDAIEDQYGMTPGESFGVQDLTSQVEEKLGVLSFGADTLNNFLGLFQASNAGSTVLTFPGFTIDVQGESYQVWNDMQFDLAFLEDNFGVLIIAVRTVTVLCVWLAVLGYLVKAYEHLVNNKG